MKMMILAWSCRFDFIKFNIVIDIMTNLALILKTTVNNIFCPGLVLQ